jgi:hypothetical protein
MTAFISVLFQERVVYVACTLSLSAAMIIEDLSQACSHSVQSMVSCY